MHPSRKVTRREPEGWLRRVPPGPPEPGAAARLLAFALLVWFQVLLAWTVFAMFW